MQPEDPYLQPGKILFWLQIRIPWTPTSRRGGRPRTALRRHDVIAGGGGARSGADSGAVRSAGLVGGVTGGLWVCLM